MTYFGHFGTRKAGPEVSLFGKNTLEMDVAAQNGENGGKRRQRRRFRHFPPFWPKTRLWHGSFNRPFRHRAGRKAGTVAGYFSRNSRSSPSRGSAAAGRRYAHDTGTTVAGDRPRWYPRAYTHTGTRRSMGTHGTVYTHSGLWLGLWPGQRPWSLARPKA